MLEKIKKRNRICISIVGSILVFFLLVGFSYAYYSAHTKKVNETETMIRTEEMNLIYTGVKEVTSPNMIPGEKFTKTFTVENESKTKTTFNIYMEDVENEFNTDLVYTLIDEDNNIVKEDIMPLTKEGKTYLKTSIEIEGKELKEYTMKIEYKYFENKDQSENKGASFTGTIGIDTEMNVTEDGKYVVNIDPNGGVYEESAELSTYVMSSGDVVELKIPTRENYTFKGWTVEEKVIENNKITVSDSNVIVVAKWELNGDVVARINEKYYTTLQSAFDNANKNDTIELLKDIEETSSNNKNVTLNLSNHKINGSITNTGDLILIDGTIENTNGSAIVNNGTLVLGENDSEVSKTNIAIIGTNIGIEQNGIFDFYDGYIEAEVAINGKYNNIPQNYYVFVDHNNEKDCQKVYLVDTPSTAVAKTEGTTEVYYYNLQDAINTTVLTNEKINVIRDFEAAYTLTVEEGKHATIDIKGFDVTTGYTITNNGTLNILDSEEEKGLLQPSVTITNNGILNINDINITQTTAANLIDNNKELNVSNSTLTALAGYAVNNQNTGDLNLDENTYLKANGYALYVNTTDITKIPSGNIVGINNATSLEINGGVITNGSNSYAIYNTGTIDYNNALVDSTSTGIYTSNVLNVNSGNIKAQSGNAIYTTATTNINGGNIESSIEAVRLYGGTTILNDGTIKGSRAISGKSFNEIRINGGTLTGDYGIFREWDNGNGTINVYDGLIEGTIHAIHVGEGYSAINLNVYGGKIIGPSAIYDSAGYRASSTINIDGGTIIGTENYGVYSSHNLTIGKDDNSLNIEKPLIQGELYGLYINAGKTNFYDGILKGKTNGYYGTISAIPDATVIKEAQEEIDTITYNINYLVASANFVEVDGNEYNSLQKAIDAIETDGTIKFISNASVKSNATIPKEKNITIDMNGYTYNTTQTIINNGILKIIDSSTDNTGTIETNESVNLIESTNNITLDKINIIKNNTSNYGLYIKGEATINNAVIKSLDKGIYNAGVLTINNIDLQSNSIGIYTNNTLNLNGGNISETSTGIQNTGTINMKDFNITVSNLGIDGGTIIMDGGTIISDNNGLHAKFITLNDGYIEANGTSGYGLRAAYNTNVNINGGKIVTTGPSSVAINNAVDNASRTITINGGEIISANIGVNITSPTYTASYPTNFNMTGGTITAEANGIETYGIASITGGVINAKGYGIRNTRILTIGTKDEGLNITTPVIKSDTYGVYNENTFNFYDGILKGQTNGYYGNVSAMQDATTINDDVEIIDGIEYKANYLVEDKNFCKVNDTEYNSLQKAIDAIDSNGTIELIASNSVKSAATISVEKTITLDLAGHTYGSTLPIVNNGTLTIIDSSEEKTGTLTTSEAVNIIENSGTLTIENMNLTKTSTTKYGISNTNILTINNIDINTEGTAIYNTKTLNINGGKITKSVTGIQNSGTVNMKNFEINCTSIGINGGTVIVDSGKIISENNGVYAKDITVNDGYIEANGTSGYGLRITANGSINLNGGKIVTTGTSSTGINNAHDNAFRTININGGEIISANVGVNISSPANLYVTYFNMAGGTITSESNGVQTYGEATITGGVINAKGYGIYNTRKLTIGTKDGEISTTAPVIQGELYGVYLNSTDANFYDGIIKGQTAGYYGYFKTIEPNGFISTSTETIEEKQYITNYLTISENIITNVSTGKSYNNIQTAIDETGENEELKLLNDVSVYYEINVASDKKIILDLAGYDIFTSQKIINDGTLTIKDSSEEKGSKISTTFAIDLITNNGTMNISNIYFENVIASNNILTNNNIVTLENVSMNSINGIKNNTAGTLNLNDCEITSTNTAINNIGILNVNGGTYTGTSYAIYSTTKENSEIKNASLVSKSNALYKNSASQTEVNNTNITGNVVNNNSTATLNYETGNTNGLFVNKGITVLTDVDLNYASSSSAITLLDNSGSLKLNDSKLELIKDSTSSKSQVGIYNTNNIEFNNSDVTVSDTSTANTHYGIKNMSSGNITINSGNINISGGNTVYGIYSDNTNNNTNILSGTINASNSTTSYGIYINNGTVTMGEYDGSGTEEAKVSTSDPLIQAIANTNGIGVKKVNGYFKYYDGKIIGSTNAKPDTTTEVEYNYETKFYNETDTGYEYCVLEYMK